MKKTTTLTLLSLILAISPASALTIKPDFSMLGKITQDGTPDGTDVTELVKSNINVAIASWEAAILKDFDLEIAFTFADLTAESAVGLHTLLEEDANTNFIKKSKIEFDLTSQTNWFFDPTPYSNEEFDDIVDFDQDGDGVIEGREGVAIAGKGAVDKWDFLSVAKHELGHALGLSGDGTLYAAERADGDIDIDAALMSALTTIPITGTHFDGNATVNGVPNLFDRALMAVPGFDRGERSTQSDADILAIASVYNLNKEEINLNPAQQVPEPSTLLGLSLTLGFGTLLRKQKKNKPVTHKALVTG